jgi:hypothetical protein
MALNPFHIRARMTPLMKLVFINVLLSIFLHFLPRNKSSKKVLLRVSFKVNMVSAKQRDAGLAG